MGRFNGVWPSRWAAFGAAITVALGAGSAFQAAHASDGSGAHPVFVAVTPCRLFDTRPAPENVGSRAMPLGAGDTFTAAVRGSNGNCSIPATALGVVMNVTVVNPTASSFLTVFPADAPQPLASNLNWTASSLPTVARTA